MDYVNGENRNFRTNDFTRMLKKVIYQSEKSQKFYGFCVDGLINLRTSLARTVTAVYIITGDIHSTSAERKQISAH